MTERERVPHPPVTDILDIAVRAYGVPERKPSRLTSIPPRGPSNWSVVLDTETTTDETQRLRFGAYQIYEGLRQRETGFFYNPDVVRISERATLSQYAVSKGIKLISLREFMERVIVRVCYGWQATIIGYNLPFDISRIAVDHHAARGRMRPGFSFDMTPERKGPKIRVKQASGRAARMKMYGPGQAFARGQRGRKVVAPQREPGFVDASTLAAALLGRSFSLADLTEHLNTPTKKTNTEHGKVLTAEYLDYALRDVQATWECFVELSRRYAEHGLTQTPIARILSEAGIGKGYLREMGIRPQRHVQPDVPPELIGKIMATYFGGRTEVNLRRLVSRVLYCDFTSMYPTVSSAMGLWPYVIAKRMYWRDATTEIRDLVQRVTLADLQRLETWKTLHAIVEVEPDGDILPVRAKYRLPVRRKNDPPTNYSIGLNHLTADQPLWFTVADCIASKLHTGRVPKIKQAIAFKPGEPQDGLRPICIAGKADFPVDPIKQDFFKRVIELRMQTEGPERNALKLVANSTGYGIFMQLDVNERTKPIAVHCYPASGPEFLVDMDKVEEPGEFFHPLLGMLITAGARLMLTIAERLASDLGIDWVFCDTDSMALAKPPAMADGQFIEAVAAVRNWFEQLNPYGVSVDLFKLEGANFGVAGGEITNQLEPLYSWAISSKRYVLFNIDSAGRPVIRKASAHGLGHLMPPYGDETGAPGIPDPVVTLDKIGVRRWQYDLWYCITCAALSGNPDQPDYSALPNLDQPAASRLAVTTTLLLSWFDEYNQGKQAANRVRPYNFMARYQADPTADWEGWREANGLDVPDKPWEPPCVIAPYDSNPRKAVRRCIDRDTTTPVPANMLKSRRDALAQYHLRPEAKRLNADYLDRGATIRRHVRASRVIYIGKEANRLEEQSRLGVDPEAEVTYGVAPSENLRALDRVREVAAMGTGKIAKAAGISRQHLAALLSGKAEAGDDVLARLVSACETIAAATNELKRDARIVLERMREQIEATSLRRFARLAGINAGHLHRLLGGNRSLRGSLLLKLKRALGA